MPEASEAIGSESSSAERVRKFREKQKQEQLEAEVTVALPCTAETPELLQCNTGETLCNVTGNVEKSRVEKIRVDKRESTGAQSDKPTDTHPPKAKRFVKPTLEEIKAYCQSRQNGVDAERFYDYYESNGWRVGKSPMKDWKAAVRTWERSEWNKGGERYGQSGSIPAACYDGTI